MLNRIIQRTSEFDKVELVGTLINAIFDYPMATKVGYASFNNSKTNACLKDILDYWSKFFQTSGSAYVLNTFENGWPSDYALNEMSRVAYGIDFLNLFNCFPGDRTKYLGFVSWDKFFTRTFNPGIRPVQSPDDPDSIASACESAPFRIAYDVPLEVKFWIKGQPYPLVDLLDDDPWASKFEGGTLYQAFLSALSHHRQNSLVSGTAVKAYNLPGTYYAESLYRDFENPRSADPVAANDSQAFLTSTAARVVIFTRADNPKIGLMAFVAVEMSEVSSNEITIGVGQHVNKGDQLGIFHFGGSTHALLFRPETKVEFNLHRQKPGIVGNNIKIRSGIARIG